MHLVERFTRVDADTIQYEVDARRSEDVDEAVDDRLPLKQDPSYGMFEYACHEGNYAMRNMLSGARAVERK